MKFQARHAGEAPTTVQAQNISPAMTTVASARAVARGWRFMSEATVKAHVSHLFTKLGVANRVQIAILVHDAAQS